MRLVLLDVPLLLLCVPNFINGCANFYHIFCFMFHINMSEREGVQCFFLKFFLNKIHLA